MGMSETATIAYGIQLNYEDREGPWDEDPEGDDGTWDWNPKMFPDEDVEVDSFGHCEYPFWVLVVPGSIKRAWRGDVKLFDPLGLNVEAEAGNYYGKVAAALERSGLKVSDKAEIGWMTYAEYS